MISYNYLIFLFCKDCSQTELVANGVCNDESNNTYCHFDGGDCTTNISTTIQATTSGTGGSTTVTATNPTTTGGCNIGWIGDAFCDDINNNMECSYDGGDCCGPNVNTQYCTNCSCLDPNGGNGGSSTTTAASTTTNPTTAGGCNSGWIGDNYCDDINNNMGCSYDGGDCCDSCGSGVNTQWCSVCACLDPNGSGGGTTCAPIITTTPNPGSYAPALNCSLQTGKNM